MKLGHQGATQGDDELIKLGLRKHFVHDAHYFLRVLFCLALPSSCVLLEMQSSGIHIRATFLLLLPIASTYACNCFFFTQSFGNLISPAFIFCCLFQYRHNARFQIIFAFHDLDLALFGHFFQDG
jgi:hypothetical protein